MGLTQRWEYVFNLKYKLLILLRVSVLRWSRWGLVYLSLERRPISSLKGCTGFEKVKLRALRCELQAP